MIKDNKFKYIIYNVNIYNNELKKLNKIFINSKTKFRNFKFI